MKSGFYSVRFASAEHDPNDGEAYSLAILAHLKDSRFVGVDLGGCKLSGTYEDVVGGGVTAHLAYTLKAGIEMPDGAILAEDTTIESDIDIAARTLEGEPQLVDIGFGPSYVRLQWLGEPA